MLTFGNFLGFWALLGIPAILAIHFLQRESRRVVTSTLFLLDQLAPQNAQGRRFERLRNSVPLWLQILAVLFLTWLLAQPRWLRSHSVQHIVIVLDSSMSILAFHDELIENFDRGSKRLALGAAKTEWQLLESDLSRPTLYSGTDRAALVAAVQKWRPHLGAHDFSPALQLGQTLLRGNGALIFVSDRSCELPEGVRLLAVGHPLDNCGFCGATVNGREWRALVRNYGTTAQKRTWWMEANGNRSPAQELTLAPGQSVGLTGQIPAAANACELFLNSDSFSVDDRLPIVLPEPKRLRLGIQANTPLTDFFNQFCGSIEAADIATDKADVQFRVYDPSAAQLPETNAVVFVVDPEPGNELLPGRVTAENNPLASDMNWSGLLCRHSFRVPAKPEDLPLVWQSERPLIFLREKGAASLLVVNFDARASNATRMPAFVLLLHRFVERIRAAKLTPETRNFDTNQSISVAADPALSLPEIDHQPGGALSAPAQPGFFEVKQGGKILLHGAAQFADAREADFRDAGFVDRVSEAVAPTITRNSETDVFAPVWALAMGAAMVGSWLWRNA
jgi:Aerotolerance regulator N-terminal